MFVHFATVHQPWPWFRQTPLGDGTWEDARFSYEDSGTADWLVVADAAPHRLPTHIPRERRILVTLEPTTWLAYRDYTPAYLNQFGTVIGDILYPNEYTGRWIHQQPALNWFYGVNLNQTDRTIGALDWQALAAPKDHKTREISIVCSNLTHTEDHRARLAFVQLLKSRFGDRIDHFGRGFRPIADKSEALTPYRYHIALENNRNDHFWTEKLADPILGDCYTFHSGCQNVADYFDTRTITPIDVRQPEVAFATIEKILADDPWPNLRPVLAANRKRLMMEHNIFAVIHRAIHSTDPKAAQVPRLRFAQRLTAPQLSTRREQWQATYDEVRSRFFGSKLYWNAINTRNRLRSWLRAPK